MGGRQSLLPEPSKRVQRKPSSSEFGHAGECARAAQATRSKMIGYKMRSPRMAGIEVRAFRHFCRKDVLPVQGWHRTTIRKISTDKTSSVAAAVLQPLEGVATPSQSMN